MLKLYELNEKYVNFYITSKYDMTRKKYEYTNCGSTRTYSTHATLSSWSKIAMIIGWKVCKPCENHKQCALLKFGGALGKVYGFEQCYYWDGLRGFGGVHEKGICKQ